MRRLLPLFPAVILLVPSPTPVQAQIRASEPATVSQTVDGTVITVEYNRPRLRGRDSIWGDEVKWQEVWTPGANDATRLTLSKDVRIGGHALAAGTWSVWLVVRPGTTWTAVFDPRADLFHTAHPDSTPDQLRFPVERRPVPMTEVLAWSFPEVTSSGTVLRMDWAGAQVDLPIEVPPTRTLAFPADSARPYEGRYALRETGAPDSVPPRSVRLAWAEGNLWMHVDPAPFPDMRRMGMLPVRTGWFYPAIVRDGQLYDVWSDVLMEFSGPPERPDRFVLRLPNDKVWAEGTRQP